MQREKKCPFCKKKLEVHETAIGDHKLFAVACVNKKCFQPASDLRDSLEEAYRQFYLYADIVNCLK